MDWLLSPSTICGTEATYLVAVQPVQRGGACGFLEDRRATPEAQKNLQLKACLGCEGTRML